MKKEEIESFVFKTLMSATKEKRITASTIALLVRTKFEMKVYTTQSVRKLINEFRREELPVLANSRGYYVSYNKEEVIAQIVSLRNRIGAQISALDGLSNLVKTIE